MEWKVGQKVVCDRPEQLLTGCVIRSKQADKIIIVCPSIDLEFLGSQEKLEQLGWRLDENEKLKTRNGKKQG